MKFGIAAFVLIVATTASPSVAFTAGSSFVGGAKQVGGGASSSSMLKLLVCGLFDVTLCCG